MDNFIQALKSTYESVSTAVVTGAPKVAAVAVVIVVGVLVARIARVVVQRVLKLVRFESLATRLGMTNVLKRAQVSSSASDIVGTLVYWTLLLFTALLSLGVLGFATSATFTAVGAMIPSVVIACAILILGLNVASFIAKLIQTTVVNAEIRQGRFIRNTAHYGMGALVVMLAAQQLGISTEILTISFIIFFGATCLAMALAIGLGSREWAGRLAEATWKNEKEQSRAMAEASVLGTQILPSTTARTKRQSTKIAA